MPTAKLDHFRNLMILAAADGKLTEEEIAFLTMRSARWGITDLEFHEALEYARHAQAELVIPPGKATRMTMLSDMLRTIAVDGHLHEKERNLFAAAAAVMEITKTELNELIDKLVGKKE
jgi:uncharacterized tellurite resistance protein B-like protein